jgi:hypothetical protein
MGLDMEVAKHCIRFPVPNELNNIVINVFVEESHGAGGAKGFGSNVFRFEVGRVTEGSTGLTEEAGYFGRCEGL